MLQNTIVISSFLFFLIAGLYYLSVFYRGLRCQKIEIFDVSLLGVTKRSIDRLSSPLHYLWVLIFTALTGTFLLYVACFIIYGVYVKPPVTPEVLFGYQANLLGNLEKALNIDK